MTRKEAEKVAEERNEQEPDWFCPLINDMCRKDCVNFVGASAGPKNKKKGMLHDIKDDDFEVFGFLCSNAMYIGNDIIVPCGNTAEY